MHGQTQRRLEGIGAGHRAGTRVDADLRGRGLPRRNRLRRTGGGANAEAVCRFPATPTSTLTRTMSGTITSAVRLAIPFQSERLLGIVLASGPMGVRHQPACRTAAPTPPNTGGGEGSRMALPAPASPRGPGEAHRCS